MTRTHRSFTMAIALASVALLALPALRAQAGEAEPSSASVSSPWVPFDVENLRFDEPATAAPGISTSFAPWLEQEQLYFNDEASAYWNSYFRGGKGQLGLTAVEYLTYDYNNKTVTDDRGVIREFHHMLHLAGSPYPGIRLFAGVGINTMLIDRGDDGIDTFFNFTGLTFDLGLEVGLPLGDRFVLEFFGRYRQFQSERGTQADNTYERVDGQWYRAQVALSFEIIRDRKGVTWGIYAGSSVNIVLQAWRFTNSREKITPNNGGALENGPSRYDILVGTNVAISEMLNFNIEGRFVGPMLLSFGVSFLI